MKHKRCACVELKTASHHRAAASFGIRVVLGEGFERVGEGDIVVFAAATEARGADEAIDEDVMLAVFHRAAQLKGHRTGCRAQLARSAGAGALRQLMQCHVRSIPHFGLYRDSSHALIPRIVDTFQTESSRLAAALTRQLLAFSRQQKWVLSN